MNWISPLTDVRTVLIVCTLAIIGFFAWKKPALTSTTVSQALGQQILGGSISGEFPGRIEIDNSENDPPQGDLRAKIFRTSTAPFEPSSLEVRIDNHALSSDQWTLEGGDGTPTGLTIPGDYFNQQINLGVRRAKLEILYKKRQWFSSQIALNLSKERMENGSPLASVKKK